ncbi:cyclic nucleotide-binding protein [Cohnella xylanilytica]|uniref:Crp/Fnr family transcriptional regulator n=1 Tax=Cohnella xylanilytica TaxID=557555 RepID=UPI001B24C898|nr:Crp/Fnr family transcriptional regulator [Cohnella xylanilytica]GIO14826.1 cyclic nucleotide-binding protein [Cohnella xylanilytica]
MTITAAKLRSAFPFFQEMDPSLVEAVLPHISEKNYRKGSLIFLEGNKGEEVFFIASGAVSIFTLNRTKKVVLSVLREGDYFGEMALINPEPGRSATAETLAPTKLYSLRKSAFLLLFDRDRGFLRHLLLNTMERLNNANQQIYDMTFLSVRARIIKRLLSLQAQQPGSASGRESQLPLRITHQQLADMVGAVRETVSKIIQELQDEGLIRIERRMIRLAEPARLEKKLQEES